jgi:hypothetical protein
LHIRQLTRWVTVDSTWGVDTAREWKTRGRRYKELKRLKVSEKVASAAIFSPNLRPLQHCSSAATQRFSFSQTTTVPNPRCRAEQPRAVTAAAR